ncbi:MAG: GlsB/YeaQ/YmgE family stress response membrane protein [Casimicrobiaceae bacterium]
MSIVWMLLIGLVIGLVAKMLTPGRDPGGFVITALIGIAGSLLASFGGQALGLYAAGQPAGFIASVVGAIVLLAIYHLVRRNSPTP